MDKNIQLPRAVLAMVSKSMCHYCLSEVDGRYATGLFTVQGELEDLPGRLKRIFLVEVMKDDGLPMHICRNCRDKAFGMEKKLQDLRWRV